MNFFDQTEEGFKYQNIIIGLILLLFILNKFVTILSPIFTWGTIFLMAGLGFFASYMFIEIGTFEVKKTYINGFIILFFAIMLAVIELGIPYYSFIDITGLGYPTYITRFFSHLADRLFTGLTIFVVGCVGIGFLFGLYELILSKTNNPPTEPLQKQQE